MEKAKEVFREEIMIVDTEVAAFSFVISRNVINNSSNEIYVKSTA